MLSLKQSLASAAGIRPRKKFHFNVSFNLQDLLNCTYVSGVIFARIRLKDGGHFSHLSQRVEVQSHTVSWEEDLKFPCKLYASASTAELEPCVCKVSIRKELRGGKSYKKLGYVRINLAEFAGAGAVQRKYLLESYNEHKHKPDNSILRIKIMLRQTSGDVLFKAPRPPVWEISEPEQDEGIQADLQSARNTVSTGNIRASTASTFSGLSTGSSSCNLRVGSSLQDMRLTSQLPGTEKNNSVGSLRDKTSDSGSSEYESASQKSASSHEEVPGFSGDISASAKQAASQPAAEDCCLERDRTKPRSSSLLKSSTLSTLTSSEPQAVRPPPEKYSLSYPRSHQRQDSDVNMGESVFSLKPRHRRIHSLSITGYASRSVSSHGTLLEALVPPSTEDTESMHSNRTRASVQTVSSKVEQSRVDTTSVINELLQGHDLRRSEADEAAGSGLKIYVDQSKGDCIVAGPELERRYSNLKPIEMIINTQVRNRRSGVSLRTESKENDGPEKELQ